jgi:RNA polymerase sigma factor (sigma-70 family)
MCLTEVQKAQVEQFMPLVKRVIANCVHGSTGIYDFDDLYQIGCIGLCKAAASYEESRQAQFETYAYVLIRNEIFKALEYANRRAAHESYVDIEALPLESAPAPEVDMGVAEALGAAAAKASGVIAKGIAAIRLQAEGYSCKEIGTRFGASGNTVSAWVSRARKWLKKDVRMAMLASNHIQPLTAAPVPAATSPLL